MGKWSPCRYRRYDVLVQELRIVRLGVFFECERLHRTPAPSSLYSTVITCPTVSGGVMRRREFIRSLGAVVAAWPVAAGAQQKATQTRRVGVLIAMAETDPEAPARLAAIRKGLREAGWGDNLHLDVRFRAGG